MTKDESILNAVKLIGETFGPKVQIADHWDGLLCSVGFQVGNELFYIDSLNQADGFYECIVGKHPPEVEQQLGVISLNELVEMIRASLAA